MAIPHRVIKSGRGTGSGSEQTLTAPGRCIYFGIYNAGISDLTFTINDQVKTIASETAYANYFHEFTEVKVTAVNGDAYDYEFGVSA